jgi:hypothetical protein
LPSRMHVLYGSFVRIISSLRSVQRWHVSGCPSRGGDGAPEYSGERGVLPELLHHGEALRDARHARVSPQSAYDSHDRTFFCMAPASLLQSSAGPARQLREPARAPPQRHAPMHPGMSPELGLPHAMKLPAHWKVSCHVCATSARAGSLQDGPRALRRAPSHVRHSHSGSAACASWAASSRSSGRAVRANRPAKALRWPPAAAIAIVRVPKAWCPCTVRVPVNHPSACVHITRRDSVVYVVACGCVILACRREVQYPAATGVSCLKFHSVLTSEAKDSTRKILPEL